MKTVGLVNKDAAARTWEIAEPVGVIAGIVPTTNPTSTVIYKSMIALKSRNAIVFSPHPSAVRCSAEAARVMHQAAVAAGAPEGSIGCLTTVSLEATQELMKNPLTSIILGTGGRPGQGGLQQWQTGARRRPGQCAGLRRTQRRFGQGGGIYRCRKIL